MIIVKVDKGIEKALRQYKSKVIKTRQMSELVNRKEYNKPSVKKRNALNKAKYVQKTYNYDID